MIRKITSKQDDERKKKRNQMIMCIILALIMILSTVGYSFGTNTSQQETTLNYNNYEFTYLDGFWNVNVGENIFSFINNPSDSYNVTSEVKPLSSYYGKPLYLYSENVDAEEEISRNLGAISQTTEYACPEGEKCDTDLQKKTCQDNFIIIKEANISKVYQDRSCVFISGPFDELAMITDSFLLKILGIQ